jgi:hypothetical protein
MKLLKFFSRKQPEPEPPIETIEPAMAYEGAVAEAASRIEAQAEQRAADLPPALTMTTATAAAALDAFLAAAPSFAAPDDLHTRLLQLAETYFTNDAHAPLARDILSAVFTNGGEVSLAGLTDRDRLFASNLVSLRCYAEAAGAPATMPVIRESSQAEDCLAETPDEWSIYRLLNLAAMASIPAHKRTAIVTSVRNEGASILEWLAHHRALGITDFFVYTNDNTDGSDKLLHILAAAGLINLIDNKVSANARVQAKILEHSLALLPALRNFHWAFYIDVDEFFMSRCEPGLTLDSFFSHLEAAFPGEQPAAICFNWKWFGSENAFEMTEGFLLQRFIHSIHNEHVKSLVRLKDVLSMRRVHVPIMVEHAWAVDSNFSRVEPNIHLPPVYGKGQINHYWNKSFQEFVLKRSRGRISAGLSGPPLDYKSFFEWGANGRRGNYDPPPERVISRVTREYDALLSLPHIQNALNDIQKACAARLREIDAEIDLATVYRNQGIKPLPRAASQPA